MRVRIITDACQLWVSRSSQHVGRLAFIRQNHLARFPADHHAGGIYVAADDIGKDGCITDAQIVKAVHAQPRIDNGNIGAWPHATG